MNFIHVSITYINKHIVGVIFCTLLALMAYAIFAISSYVFDNFYLDTLIIVILISIIITHFFSIPQKIKYGSDLAAKQILEFAVLLLGAGTDISQILNVGWHLLGAISISVLGGCLVAWIIGTKILHMPSKISVLVGVGNSICGNSAVVAVAQAIQAKPEQVATVIGVSAILGISQIMVFPLLLPIFGLDFYEYGIIVGLSVYAVSQVVAASFSVSIISGKIATIVKLARILLLGPMIISLSLIFKSHHKNKSWKNLNHFIPWFIVGFIILVCLNSTNIISDDISGKSIIVSKFLFVVAMAGLGLNIELKKLLVIGPKVAITTLGTMLFMIMAAIITILILQV